MEKELIVKWRIKESETARILDLLPSLVEKARNEEGNVFFHIYQSVDHPNELILHERYVNAEAVETHKATEHYREIVAGIIIPCLEVREVSVVRKLL